MKRTAAKAELDRILETHNDVSIAEMRLKAKYVKGTSLDNWWKKEEDINNPEEMY